MYDASIENIDGGMIRAMIRLLVRPASPLITRRASSTVGDRHPSLQLFPTKVQHTITALQDLFDGSVNADDGLFELYDKETTNKMWKVTMERNSKIQSGVASGTISNAPTVNTDADEDEDDDDTFTMTKQAGVFVLFVPNEKELSIVFTRRSKHLSSHASQISFPGGHYDAATDDTLVDTAIREAVEELHTHRDETTEKQFRDNLYIFGRTTSVPSLRGTPVTSVLGIYNISRHCNSVPITKVWSGNPSEVELVFTVPITTLVEEQMQASTSDSTIFKRSATKSKSSSPQYPTANGTIWGLTAYILQPIVSKILIPFVNNKTND